MATKKKTDGQEQATAPKGGDFHKAPAKGRKHVATYARDKRKGGYLIRVAKVPTRRTLRGGEVPVLTRMDRTESSREVEGAHLERYRTRKRASW
jgi:hypothetical protein